MSFVGDTNQSEYLWHHDGARKPLQKACDNKLRCRLSSTAEHRGHGKKKKPETVDTPPSETVAEVSADHQPRPIDERVSAHNALEFCSRRM